MGLFGRSKKQEGEEKLLSATNLTNQKTVSEISDTATADPFSVRSTNIFADSIALQTGSGLHQIVQLMHSKGEGQMTLSLKQDGDDMNLRLYNNGEEIESTIVTPESLWFTPVANLYTEEEQSERGEWNRALIVLNPPVGEEMSVQASFLNTLERNSNNLKYVLNLATLEKAEDEAEAEKEETENSKLADPQSAETRATEDKTIVVPPSDGQIENTGNVDDAASLEQETPQEESEPMLQPILPPADEAEENKELVESKTSAPLMSPAFNSTQDNSTSTEELPVKQVEDVTEDQPTDHTDLPEHLDDWTFEEDTFESAPSTAQTPDVSTGTRRINLVRPSNEKLAEGNLVLTEADVVARLMPIQEKLFGTEGTALDAATVLVRIRTLGSYYDALTHVRHNGFWDQQKTFDLIPEDVLKVLELKTASYKEGKGAPLAMSLRFTPGIPPVASFDYSNEQAYVQYNDQLPAQQYVEELRMFPRTGANIPAHMSEALASWAL